MVRGMAKSCMYGQMVHHMKLTGIAISNRVMVNSVMMTDPLLKIHLSKTTSKSSNKGHLLNSEGRLSFKIEHQSRHESKLVGGTDCR